MKINRRAARLAALKSCATVMTLDEMKGLQAYVTVRAWKLCAEWMHYYVQKTTDKSQFRTWSGLALGLVHIYEAGRVDGIREERARRRQTAAA